MISCLAARVPRPNSKYHQIPQLPHQAQHQGLVVNWLLERLLRNKGLSEEAIPRVEEVAITAREGVSRYLDPKAQVRWTC